MLQPAFLDFSHANGRLGRWLPHQATLDEASNENIMTCGNPPENASYIECYFKRYSQNEGRMSDLSPLETAHFMLEQPLAF